MNISKEIVVYILKENNFFCLLVLSNLQGWGILKYLIRSSFFQYYYNIGNKVKNFILGFYKIYLCFLKLKGMGFKSIVIIKNLIFKLGFSHRVLYSITNNLLLVYEHKHLFKINTRSLNLIKNIIYILETIKLPVAYKIKGLFIKGYFQKLKISSKKSKF